MRMNKVIMLVAPLAVALSMTPAARAARGTGPCREDVQKFCPDAQRGPALRDCLKQHASELSPACQEHVKHAKAKVEAWRQACQDDVQKFCPDAKPGGGALRDCLKQHEAELSPACQEHVKQAKAKAEAWRQACQDDVQKFCADTKPGSGNILKCLHQHNDELSKSCQDKMAQAQHRHRHHAAAAQPNPQ